MLLQNSIQIFSRCIRSGENDIAGLCDFMIICICKPVIQMKNRCRSVGHINIETILKFDFTSTRCREINTHVTIPSGHIDTFQSQIISGQTIITRKKD